MLNTGHVRRQFNCRSLVLVPVYVASNLAHCTVIHSGVMERQVLMPGQRLQINMKCDHGEKGQ